MRNLKNVIFVLVLTTLALAPCALAKSPLLLLQEGIYAEETEGDLDKAIGLYEQVIDQACEVERIAAKATYKLGGCYLKKDDKASAVKYFQAVVEKYPSQRAYINQAKEQLEKIAPEEKELPLFAQVPSDVLGYLSGQYAVIAAEGNMKNLKFNNHIYYVSPELKLFRGGYGYYQQPTNSSTPERIRISGTTYPDQSFYDVIGNEMKVEIEDRPGRPGYYDIYWKPTVEIPAGQPFYYGWCRDKSIKLNPIANTNAYPVTMQNQYGSPVLEVFFLVLPKGFAVAEQSETFTKKETVAGFDIYQWKKEIPANTKHVVNVTLNNNHAKQAVSLNPLEQQESIIDLSMPETTIKSFVKAVYDGNLEAAKACVSKDGYDYDEFMEMLATESNHPFQAMIKAMDTSIPVEIISKDITEDRCKIKWYFTLGRVYYFGDTKIEKGKHQKFGSYLELVGDKWLIRDI